jgi:ribosomal protein S18 acetylase RimI-like enzyme
MKTATPVTTRRAGPDDAACVMAMVAELAAVDAPGHPVEMTADRWAEMLDRSDVVVLLAEKDGEPVGYASALRRIHLWSGRDILALDDLYVRSGSRDAGVGRMLMGELARVAAPEQLLIRWEVEEDNTAAQRFYRRLGASLHTKVIASWRPEGNAPAGPA